MKALFTAILVVTTLPSLPAQDPSNGEYRAPTVPLPDPVINYTPLALMSATPTGTIVALDANGNILNGNGKAWQKLGGNLVQVSAGSDTEIWGVNANHLVFRWTGNTWQTMPGSLKQVAVAKGGGLVMGIEWAPPNRVLRWDSATNAWIPLAGTPPIVQLAIGSPNHVFGITAANEIYKLKRPEWIEWRKLKGALKQISVGADGTVGGIGTDGVTYARKDEDVTTEINNPSVTPTWVPLDAPAVYIEVVNIGSVFVVDKFGFPAAAQPLAGSGNTLTITSSTVTETKLVSPLGGGFIELRDVAGTKGEVNSSQCITIEPGTDINLELAKLKNVPVDPTKVSFTCTPGKFTKIQAKCAPRGGLDNMGKLMDVNSAGGCTGSSSGSTITTTDPPQIDGLGTDCAPRIFLNRSAHSSVKFILPGGRVGERVTIPYGAHNRYVFPACNRVWWDNLAFSCGASKMWTLTLGRYDADAYCTGSPGRSPYTSISDRGYDDK